ncbi:NADP-dependent succinic semialdehyde dehydrogenase OS=Streptomyces cyaneofuscatus OX=66883 GN=G3I52_01415 PE=4 SV=1 [Streptomyces cyaneofuscatus]
MRWYADRAEGGLLADEHPDPADVTDSGASRALVRYRPLGVVLAVMPWNFPLWQAVRFAAPALMAGNVGLLKHASNVPQTALYLEDLFHRAGFPAGCFPGRRSARGAVEAVLRDPRIAAATLTEVKAACRAVAATAGDEIKKTVLARPAATPTSSCPRRTWRRPPPPPSPHASRTTASPVSPPSASSSTPT